MAVVALGLAASARAEGVSCSVIDYLYYSSACCDSTNDVNCVETIPHTDKDAVDNLATLKRADGTDCQNGDSITFTVDTGSGSSGIVCGAANEVSTTTPSS